MVKRGGLLLCFLLLVQCTPANDIVPFERTKILMDTFFQVSIYDQDKSSDELERVMQLIFDRIEYVDRIANIYNDSSLITKINREAAYTEVEIDTVLRQLIQTSADISIISGGAFDITIQSVERLWNFTPEHYCIPGDSLLAEHLRWVNSRNVVLRDNRVALTSPFVKIDLGGIAKGYAVDAAIDVLRRNGVTDALVNAGGNLRAVCSDLTRGKRRVWIKHPRTPGELFGYFPMDAGCVSTSGDYERYFIADAVRYHHILDPKTGYPASKCISATVQAESAMMADALSTAVFVLGPTEGMQLIEKLPLAEGVILFEEQGEIRWIVSSGLRKKFSLK